MSTTSSRSSASIDLDNVLITALRDEVPPFWDTEHVPANVDSEEFQAYITVPPPDDGEERDAPGEDKYTSWLDAPNPETFASFGDAGVTASVNVKGDLMQFSAYLGAGTSGMFAADKSPTPEPYCMNTRLSELRSLAKGEFIGYGLRIPALEYGQLPHMSYLFDRWPRYSLAGEEVAADIQWMVHDETVLQQHMVHNKTEDDRVTEMDMVPNIRIRELEYLDSGNSFNDSVAGHGRVRAAHNYGWILKNRILPAKPSKDSDDEVPPPPPPDKTEDVAVLMSVFINGKAQRWEYETLDPEKPCIKFPVTFPGKTTTEVVVAYKMILLPRDEDLSQHSWTDVMISADVADISGHLARQAKSFKRFSPTLLDINADLGNLPVGVDPHLAIGNTVRGLPGDDQSPREHIDFLVRRNLEHILSVCAIPFKPSSLFGEVVALTCGDMSGHRICHSAS